MTLHMIMINANLTAMRHFNSKYFRMVDGKEQIEKEQNFILLFLSFICAICGCDVCNVHA